MNLPWFSWLHDMLCDPTTFHGPVHFGLNFNLLPPLLFLNSLSNFKASNRWGIRVLVGFGHD